MSYNKQVTKDFGLNIHAGLTHNENKIEDLFGAPYDNGNRIHQIGYALNSYFIYPTDGLLQEDDFTKDAAGNWIPKEGVVFLMDRNREISTIWIQMRMVRSQRMTVLSVEMISQI